MHKTAKQMKYIVITTDPLTNEKSAFATNWFDSEHYNPDFEMVVIDRVRNAITFDGETWQNIEKDNL